MNIIVYEYRRLDYLLTCMCKYALIHGESRTFLRLSPPLERDNEDYCPNRMPLTLR